jgi:hypothetical protein
MTMTGDRGAFGRIALTSLVVAAIVFFALAAYFPWAVSINFALGMATGLVSLGSLHWMVYDLTAGEPGRRGGALWVAGILHLAKYGVIALALYALFATGRAHAPALAAGFTLPTAVLCLKEVGRRLNAGVGVQDQRPTEIEEGVRESPGVER